MPAGCPRWWRTGSPVWSSRAAIRPRWPRPSARSWPTRSGRAPMGRAGRERALRLFDWDRSAPSSSSRSTPESAAGARPVSDRLFAFRWDVDHRVCITDGLPRIREVCRDFGVPNTFFVNLGRSTNLREWIGKGVTRSQGQAGRPGSGAPDQEDRLAPFPDGDRALPAGGSQLRARAPGSSRPKATSSGCTAAWTTSSGAAGFTSCPSDAFRPTSTSPTGISCGTSASRLGFSSPGFYSRRAGHAPARPAGLSLQRRRHWRRATPRRRPTASRSRHWTIPVTLSGPRTIPFLEYHGAKGTPDAEMLRTARRAPRRARRGDPLRAPLLRGRA